MKEAACCFTGHRDIPRRLYKKIDESLKSEITRLYECGYRDFYAGGALGFDLLASETVAGLKKELAGLRLILALPCKNHVKGWNASDRFAFERLLPEADEVIYVSEEYFNGCMQKRNRFLIERSSFCLCYMTRASGGTAYTASLAEKNGLTVKNLAEAL